MICNNTMPGDDYQSYAEDCPQSQGFGNYGCIVNLIIILIVLQFLTGIINGGSCTGN